MNTPVCPRYVRKALTSFQGLSWVSPKCPAWGAGHLGLARGAWRHHERMSDPSISSCQWLTRMSTSGSTQGKLIERTQWFIPHIRYQRNQHNHAIHSQTNFLTWFYYTLLCGSPLCIMVPLSSHHVHCIPPLGHPFESHRGHYMWIGFSLEYFSGVFLLHLKMELPSLSSLQ